MKFIKKRDLIVLVALLLLAGGLALFYATRSAGVKATVTVEGGKTRQIDLSQDEIYQIDDAALPVTLEVKDGAIRFINSQCPDHLCEGFGFICNEGEYAICMPAGVAVHIYG